MGDKTMMAVCGVVYFLFMAALILHEPADDVRAEAIQRGYALHCPQTGEFAWKGECDG